MPLMTRAPKLTPTWLSSREPRSLHAETQSFPFPCMLPDFVSSRMESQSPSNCLKPGTRTIPDFSSSSLSYPASTSPLKAQPNPPTPLPLSYGTTPWLPCPLILFSNNQEDPLTVILLVHTHIHTLSCAQQQQHLKPHSGFPLPFKVKSKLIYMAYGAPFIAASQILPLGILPTSC